MERSTYLIFVVQAYEVQTPDGSVLDCTTLRIVCKTSEEAIQRSKNLIEKKFYRVAEINEFYEEK